MAACMNELGYTNIIVHFFYTDVHVVVASDMEAVGSYLQKATTISSQQGIPGRIEIKCCTLSLFTMQSIHDMYSIISLNAI